MTFDEQVSPGSPAVTGILTVKQCILHSDSVPYVERPADADVVPVLVPVSPCSSEERSVASSSSASAPSSITGKLGNIKHKYHVDPRVLGAGIHGSVRECIERTTGERFAVKTVRKAGVKPDGLAREIMLLREMKHRSIVRLVDVFEDANYVHLVTELCEGGELFDRIVEKSSDCYTNAPCFAEDDAARIVAQILTAVSYMHDRGIAHRDIKPENILFETKDHNSPMKIVDFGLARKYLGRVGEPRMSAIVGTPYYIAPEVLRKRYEKSCDLWSVGVIAYILMCGYPPFNGANNGEVHDAVRRGRYRFPAKEWSGASRESKDFVRSLLQKNPKKRMTAEQALKHPWIAMNFKKNVIPMEEDHRQDQSSVEVVFHEQSRRDCIICDESPLNRLISRTDIARL